MNTLLQLLHERPADTPAMVESRRTLLVGDVLETSARMAAGLRALGVRKGDIAVVAAAPDANFVCLTYAAMRCGLQLAIVDPEMGRDNYREKLRQLNAQWAFVDYRLLLLQEHPIIRFLYFWWSKKGIYFPYSPQLRTIATGHWLPIVQKHTPLRKILEAKAGLTEEPGLSDADEFLITYTSGSTALPKGVVHQVGALGASVRLIADLLGQGNNRALATHLPQFALIGLNAGVTVHLWNQHLSPEAKIQFIEQHQITTLFGPPSDYLPLIAWAEQRNGVLPACLQHCFMGSAPVYRSFLERFIRVLPPHVQLTCLYGMTENLVVATIDGREKATLPTDAGDILGEPVPGVELQIAPDGEMLLRSPQIYARYLHLSTRDAWHASGDLGFLDEQGRIVLTGRKKDMIIRRNFNLYPGLYEPTINRIPGVVESAFVGVFDEQKHDEVVGLFVETHTQLSPAAFRKQLETGAFSIDREALPDLIFFETLPRGGRQQKVDKNALRQRLQEHLNR